MGFLREVKGNSVASVVQKAAFGSVREAPLCYASGPGLGGFSKVLQQYLSAVWFAGQVWGELSPRPLE